MFVTSAIRVGYGGARSRMGQPRHRPEPGRVSIGRVSQDVTQKARVFGRPHRSDGRAYGFRKIRRALGVRAFGVNAMVLPPGYQTGRHYHDQQVGVYFVHSGQVEIEFGDGSSHAPSWGRSTGGRRYGAEGPQRRRRGRRLPGRRRQGRLRGARRAAYPRERRAQGITARRRRPRSGEEPMTCRKRFGSGGL